MGRPLVSIITPAFNAAATIGETVRSALGQTLGEIELIVVDDGSADASLAEAEAAAGGDPRVILIRRSWSGTSAARNAAIAAARGKYIAPLDADDLWHPEKLARQVAVAEAAATSPGFVYSYFRRIDGAGRIVASGERVPVRGRALHRLLYRNFVGTGSAILAPREAVLAVGGYDEDVVRSEDYLLQLKLAARHPVDVAPEYLIGYRITPGSMVMSRERMFQAWLDIRGRLPRLCPDIVRDPTGRTHALKCLDIAQWRRVERHYLAAIALTGRAIWADPLVSLFQLQSRVTRALRRRRRPAPSPGGPHFYEAPVEPTIGDDPYAPAFAAARLERIDARRMAALAPLDEP